VFGTGYMGRFGAGEALTLCSRDGAQRGGFLKSELLTTG